jgi:divalent metal cation (Fe/Co/Zn/Cd) transporter
VLTYSDAHIPLGAPLWGTKLRSLFTFLGGIVLLSAIELAGGRIAALAALAIAVVIFSSVYLLSPKPAYEVVNREHPSDDNERPGR